MKTRLLITTTLLLVMATMAFAVMPIPTTISYQGRLTSSTGTPITGTKNMTFKIYDAGGAMLWMSGAVPVTCTDGLFSVVLGAGMPPITPDVVANPGCQLGIQVESDPELSPRTPLSSVPFSYTSLIAPLYLPLGGGTLTGPVTWDFGTSDVKVEDFGASSALTFTGPLGPSIQLESNGTGSMTLYSSTGTLNLQASASAAFGGSLILRSPAGATTHMFLGDAGDGATVLPSSSVDANEILDEPGISGVATGSSTTLSDVSQNLTTVQITTPAPGYVFLTGQLGEVDLAGTTGSNWAFFGIENTSGALPTTPFSVVIGASAFPSTAAVIYAPSVQRVFWEPAGTYTFYLVGLKGGAGGAANAYFPTLNAIYLPTFYGPIMVAGNPDGTSKTQAVSTGTTGAGIPATGIVATDTQLIDLRELQIKAAKAEADAQKAKLELLQAQLNQQTAVQTNR